MVSRAANFGVWQSSTTVTADTSQKLCPRGRGFFHGVIISSGVAAATFSLVSSTGTPSKTIATVDSSAKNSYFYDTPVISTNTTQGMAYTTVGTAATTILYECY